MSFSSFSPISVVLFSVMFLEIHLTLSSQNYEILDVRDLKTQHKMKQTSVPSERCSGSLVTDTFLQGLVVSPCLLLFTNKA